MAELWSPFQFEFFRNGLLVATLAGALCGLIGTYVVLRGLSYLGHGLSHAVFGGAAASAVVGVNFFLGAGLWGLASALAIGRVARRRIIGGDAAIGVITTASFALGLALFALFGQARRNPEALLFGNVLGVDRLDVAAVASVTAFAVLVIVLGYRSLLFATFDPDVAQASGVRTARVDALLMLVLAVSILVTIKVVGAVLVAAALVIPATVARMLTSSFHRMLWLATGIGALCGFVGMIASYHLDVAPGASIVLVGALVFGVVFAVTGTGGLRRVGAAG